jgi:hypothetical protein
MGEKSKASNELKTEFAAHTDCERSTPKRGPPSMTVAVNGITFAHL